MNKIEEMRRNMTEAGAYSKEDIEKICKLESQYIKECEAEGYPSFGGNYDLRCAESRKYDEFNESIII